jgi:hypothetical protein
MKSANRPRKTAPEVPHEALATLAEWIVEMARQQALLEKRIQALEAELARRDRPEG